MTRTIVIVGVAIVAIAALLMVLPMLIAGMPRHGF